MRYKTITELSKSLLPYMLNNTGSVAKGNAYHVFNVVLESKTCKYDIDLGLTTGHTKIRWKRLVSLYIDRDKLTNFIKLAKSLDNQCSVSMQFKSIAGKKLDHQYGNCLLAVCYCNKTLTLFSRTCFAGYMSYFDLALAYKIACEIDSSENISFRWHIIDLQVSYLRSLQVIMLDSKLSSRLSYLSKHPKKLTQASLPWQRIVGVYKRRFLCHYDKVGVDILKEAKYGPTRRFIRRWLILQKKLPGNYPKSFTLKDITL